MSLFGVESEDGDDKPYLFEAIVCPVSFLGEVEFK